MLFSVFLEPGGKNSSTGSMRSVALRQPVGMGARGSYLELSRTWTDGDTLHFSVPMQLHVSRYSGLTVIPGHERYAVQLGPILLCAVGGIWNRSIDSMLIRGVTNPLAAETWLEPQVSSSPTSPHPTSRSSSSDDSDEADNRSSSGGDDNGSTQQPSFVDTKRHFNMDALRFGVIGNPGISFVPYFLVQEEIFEVYPAFE